LDVKDKKILVIGAGLSGVAAASFLASRGATVALNDRKPLEEWSKDALALKEKGVGCLSGDPPSWLLDQIDLLIISPGVPTKSIPVRYVERRGIPVIGEIELAFKYLKGRIVGITGSNGKTTTTTLIGELLKNGGLPTQVGGNIGRPLISLVEDSIDDGWTVIELSSFQLETIVDFHPTVAMVLNVTPDHMDRYESLTDYAAAKHRIFMNQAAGDVAILNADDQLVSSWANGLRAHVVLFSVKKELEEGIFLRGRNVVSRTREGERVLISRDDMQLRGLHNLQNVMAGLAAGLACGVSLESMQETIKSFRPVEHRLEHVRELKGIKFYNDSKATNVDATIKALEAFADDSGQVLLILGGRGKNAPYTPLSQLVQSKVRRLILIGEDANNIERDLGEVALIERAADMKDAVLRAYSAAKPGDTVLLAPACASFDMFDNYEHRGRVFKEAVASLE
jgi:UDP-N-acetylmuramoylalanine--D-glutamate ligase